MHTQMGIASWSGLLYQNSSCNSPPPASATPAAPPPPGFGCRRPCPATSACGTLPAVRQREGFWDEGGVVVRGGFLVQRHLRRFQKSHFDLDGFLGRRFKVWDRFGAFGLAPLRRFCFRYPPFRLLVDLVAHDDEGEVVRVPRVGLRQELVAPGIQLLKRLFRRDVVHQHARVGAAVEGNTQGLKPFLARRVPNLQRHQFVVNHHFLRQKIRTNRRLVLVAETFVAVLIHQRRFTHAAVAQYDELEKHLFPAGRRGRT